ncbi:MAG: hypothetical protein ACTSYR_01250, partial [Candidatus Odinarchaeia archaeon]
MMKPLNLTSFGQVFPETGYGLAGDLFYALIFVILAIFFAFIIYFLIEKEKEVLLKYLLGFALAFSSIVIITLYVSIIIQQINLPEGISLPLFIVGFISSIILGLITAYLMINQKINQFLRNASMIFYSVTVSSFLALVIPTWTLVLILIGISIYDIYAVREGPIRKAIELSEAKKVETFSLTVIISQWEIGLGDLVFYSILVCHTILYFNIFIWFMTIISLVIGLGFTLIILTRNRLIPGLPVALFTGMIPILITLVSSI